VADQEGVQHVAGPHRLGRVVAHLGAFLAPVQRLDAGIDVQTQGRSSASRTECIRLGRIPELLAASTMRSIARRNAVMCA